MEGETLALVAPTMALEAAFWEMVAAFDAAGERYLPKDLRELAERDYGAFVALLEARTRGEQVPEGYVPANTYWLVRDGSRIVGRSDLRHRLTPALEDVGGHIGYAILPSMRRRGYGTRILALTLAPARALGLDRAMVTCNTANIGSARIIEKNGGVLAGQGISPSSGVLVSRYWIAL